MAHELPPLPYDYTALEPIIDEKTMHLHHDMHHAAYVKNLNAALDKHPELHSKKPEDLIRDLNAVPEDIRGPVRNNGGGHVNHTMFWQIMRPKGGRNQENLRRLQDVSGKIQCRRSRPVRLRMGLAGGQAQRRCADRIHTQPGQSVVAGPLSNFWQRRLGARLLSEIQQSAAGISAGLVGSGQLGRNQQTLPGKQKVVGKSKEGNSLDLGVEAAFIWGALGPLGSPISSATICP